MATKRRPTKRSSESGSTLYGVLAGLLLGLIVAAGVAFYVTQAPMPFVDRASRQTEQAAKPDPRQAPDPNGGLFGRDGAAGTAPSGPTATAPAPLPGLTSPGAPPLTSDQNDDLGALIAGLPPEPQASRTAPPATAVKPPAATRPAPSAPSAPSTGKPATTGTYYLQAGAYRVLEDAESLRARIILLGLPVAIERAEVKSMQINRVRVGPFARLDDMNRARAQLGENKIESNVVRQ